MFGMAYFRTEAEALHLAVSEDGLRWCAVNDNRPVLAGAVGAKSLRDPFVFPARDGQFHLLATNSWSSAEIIHAVSDDLIHWSAQELLPVMRGVPGTRNCWAPECFRDQEAGLYRIIWSSATGDPSGPSDGNHRIWQATTRDFAALSHPEIFLDPGYSVIDATVAHHDGTYLLAFKDERGDNHRPLREGAPWKAIRVCAARSGSGPWTEVSEFVTPSLTEGPALFRRGGRWMMIFDHFMTGQFGAAESKDGRHWTPITDKMTFPPGPRHANVFEIDAAVGENLLRHFG